MERPYVGFVRLFMILLMGFIGFSVWLDMHQAVLAPEIKNAVLQLYVQPYYSTINTPLSLMAISLLLLSLVFVFFKRTFSLGKWFFILANLLMLTQSYLATAHVSYGFSHLIDMIVNILIGVILALMFISENRA